MRILIVEDESTLNRTLQGGFTRLWIPSRYCRKF